MAEQKVFVGKEGAQELFRRLKLEIGKFQSFEKADPAPDGTPDVAVEDRKTNVIYLVEDSGSTGTDVYKEWIWSKPAGQAGTWECIGDTSMDLSGYALKSEMSVEQGTGADADKTTITLKSGTSATVLTAHQDISGKADRVTNGTENHFASLTSTGNLADSGFSSGSFKAKASQSRTFTNDSATKTVDTVTEDVDGDISVTFKEIQTASTSVAGLVQLEDSYSSTSTTKAATPNSVKAAYDLATGKYSLPAGGIPSTDMASAVQASLGKADSAIQHVYAGQEELTPVSQTVTIPYAEVEQPVHEVTIGGRTYHTVTMPDGKEWLAENLDYQFCEVGGSGNPAEAHAWYFNNDQATYGASGRNCGLLYNGYATVYLEEHKDTLLPSGWRVPTSADFSTMLNAVHPLYPARALKGPADWADPQWEYSNVTEFNVVPSGYYSASGNFGNDTGFCGLMSSTTTTSDKVYITRYDLVKTDPFVSGGQVDILSAASIRLINDTPVSPLPTYRGGLMTSGMTEKLEGIESHAEVNVQADWNVSDSASDAFIKNKPANLVQDAEYVHTDSNYTTAEKSKLEGIATGAQVNVIEHVYAGNTELQPDGTKKVTIPYATENTGGLITDNMAVKLSGIEANAEVNVQSDWAEVDTTSDAFIQNKPTVTTETISGTTYLRTYGGNGVYAVRADADSQGNSLTLGIDGTLVQVGDTDGNLLADSGGNLVADPVSTAVVESIGGLKLKALSASVLYTEKPASATVVVDNNKFNMITGTPPASITLSCSAPQGQVVSFAAQVTAGSTDSTLSIEANGQATLFNKAAGNTLEAYKTYQISCLNNCWTMAAFEVPT